MNKSERIVLKPEDIPENKLRKKYHNVEDIFGNFPRGGGGVVQTNATQGADGWTVQLAVVMRDLLNHKKQPLPDGEMLDIEATKGKPQDVVCNSREIELSGYRSELDPAVIQIINDRKVGFVTRERGGAEADFSVEAVMLLITKGIWLEAKDTQFERKIFLIEIDPTGKITYREFKPGSVAEILPVSICTEKVLLAVRSASDIGKILNK